jgi:hypothetical protein
MGWRILVNFIRQSILKLKAHSGFHDLFMLPMEKSVTFTGACANEIIPSINRLFFYKAKEGRHVRINL